MEESTFVEVCFSRREILAVHWSKTIQNWIQWRGKKGQFDLTCVNLPKVELLRAKSPSQPVVTPVGKGGCVHECLASPAMQDAAGEAHFSVSLAARMDAANMSRG